MCSVVGSEHYIEEMAHITRSVSFHIKRAPDSAARTVCRHYPGDINGLIPRQRQPHTVFVCLDIENLTVELNFGKRLGCHRVEEYFFGPGLRTVQTGAGRKLAGNVSERYSSQLFAHERFGPNGKKTPFTGQ